VKCRGLQEIIAQLRTRCCHGPELPDPPGLEGGAGFEDGAGLEGGAAPSSKRGLGGGADMEDCVEPSSKRAKLDAGQSMSAGDLPEELQRGGQSTEGKKGELAARLENHPRSDAGADGAGVQHCSWVGKVCDLPVHLSESCGFEPMKCPNAVAGCKKSVLRKDITRHASVTCAYRKVPCAHCHTTFEAHVGHEGRCPKALIMCPNRGCGATVCRDSMGDHRGVCGWEEVECPSPCCEKRMLRVEVQLHVETSMVVHFQKEIAHLKTTIKALEEGARKRDQAQTLVFTWSTGIDGVIGKSEAQTFADGWDGQCVGKFKGQALYLALSLSAKHSVCTMHFNASILDKDGKVLRVVNRCDVPEPPKPRTGHGNLYIQVGLTAADKRGALRTNGTIKLRMVVHLYLPK
jgi:hypothetical protein